MMNAEEYLKKLQEREPQLFPEPLRKSTLTDKDLLEIEKALGYQLPEQYKEFLQSYQLLDMTVSLSEDAEFYIEWHNISGVNATEWLGQLKESDVCVCDDDAFREAGYLYLGAVSDGHFVLYDLVDGTVGRIYHEEVFDMFYECGIENFEGGAPEKLREYFEDYFDVFADDFYDFLDFVCLGYQNDN
ncbi:MAG: SMI1/KNR4 family protein [Lachnospiraceae bacterium]